ncbi:MAG: hypothetical protein KKA05_01540 [Alphaproteobacteria bacterium]|nr:hypothetical protein [Alphaproteobacteria bacterium]MBU0858624.1 hypothetical protein [Alphaproteobacteria bacterium]
MKPINPEDAALQDIVSRPAVTGEGREAKDKKPPFSGNAGADSGIPAKDAAIIEPDSMERAASKVISKAIDEAKQVIGMAPDHDFSVLMAETLGGMFAAIRGISGRPWVRFAVAGGAIAISIIPPALRYMAAKQEQTEETKDGKK